MRDARDATSYESQSQIFSDIAIARHQSHFRFILEFGHFQLRHPLLQFLLTLVLLARAHGLPCAGHNVLTGYC